MLKKILGGLFAALLIAGIINIVNPPAAQAITCAPWPLDDQCQGGIVGHSSNNTGYDQPIAVVCKFGDAFYSPGNPRPDSQIVPKLQLVREGELSKKYCGDDTDVIFIRTNEELWCYENLGGTEGWTHVKMFDAQGPHKINDFWDHRNCTLRRD